MNATKQYNVNFLHTDGTIRDVKIEAFDIKRAKLKFEVNWGLDMEIIDITYIKI
jgi:hypothetical protein